ncbi:sunset domain-containing protein [Nocardioides sp. Soil796]|uniref:sunset domain-containing protein n=1 Tax=Nocardioides sp. Soil796 TaxID=1736412 RepID=UPI00070CD94B|nr:hypothetical protein [Nocardioides sp. Soil796]KRF20364.1 hypothetical protein ASH02_21845 [Nocardioides sp. Soil796]
MGKRHKNTLLESAAEAAENLRPHLESAVDTAKEAVENARDRALPLLEDARDKAAPIIAEGRALAAERAHEAREKAGPLLAEGRALATERAHEAREKAAPLLAEGRALATERALAGRDATVAKVNELRGIEPEPKGGKLKKLLFFGVLVALGGVLVKKLRGTQGPGDNWQSTYTPAPAPSAAKPTEKPGAPAERAEDDQAAATPDEAISDAVESPHPDTTPDDPAEVVDLKAFADTPAPADVPAEGPYGAGSAAPLEDGAGPDDSFTVKGNADSMLYHTPESPSYARTKAEVWFTDAETAAAAGFKAWNHKQQH